MVEIIFNTVLITGIVFGIFGIFIIIENIKTIKLIENPDLFLSPTKKK